MLAARTQKDGPAVKLGVEHLDRIGNTSCEISVDEIVRAARDFNYRDMISAEFNGEVRMRGNHG
jgi:hypothetical protein